METLSHEMNPRLFHMGSTIIYLATLMAIHNERGKIGEDSASRFLVSIGHKILYKNMRLGKEEIDIISQKDAIIHIIEVKTVRMGSRVQPEDNFTSRKWKHILHATHILEARSEFHGKQIQIDLACVYLNYETRKAHIKIIENVNIE